MTKGLIAIVKKSFDKYMLANPYSNNQIFFQTDTRDRI